MLIRKFLQGEATALYSVFHSAIHGQALPHYSWEQIEAWAAADFRSVNGQIEYLLTECVRQRNKSGRYVPKEFKEEADA